MVSFKTSEDEKISPKFIPESLHFDILNLTLKNYEWRDTVSFHNTKYRSFEEFTNICMVAIKTPGMFWSIAIIGQSYVHEEFNGKLFR